MEAQNARFVNVSVGCVRRAVEAAHTNVDASLCFHLGIMVNGVMGNLTESARDCARKGVGQGRSACTHDPKQERQPTPTLPLH